MDKVLLIYNSNSGKKNISNYLDNIVEEFQKVNYQVVPYKILNFHDVNDEIKSVLEDNYHCIAIAGGDGTINKVINVMIKNQINLPIGIFPWGTSNDLAAHFGITRDIKSCCKNVINNKIKCIDIGKVNDEYFLNVAAAGVLTDVSYKTNVNIKSVFGNLAYYFKGLEQLPNLKTFSIKIICEQCCVEENVYLFLVLNGSIAGGFNFLNNNDNISDGKLDFIAIKNCNQVDLVKLFMKLLKEGYLQDDNIIHIRTDRLYIHSSEIKETVIDGELGPSLPININVIPKAIKVFIP